MSEGNGRVAIVTGGSRGIGAAIARRLARDGVTVVLTYVSGREAALNVVSEIEAEGGRALALGADLADLDAIAGLFDEVASRYNALDVLVNNAGIYEYLSLEAITPEHYHRQFDVNVRGLLFASQEAAKRMKRGGGLINISSGAATATPATMAVYSATKAAVNALTLSLAAELGPRGITVNAVSPGVTETEGVRTAISKEARAFIISQTPMGRLGTPEEVADVVAFLASNDARWVTGQILGASGGLR